MIELEKVIKAIEICYSKKHNCTECELFYVEDCNDKLMRDVLELLKEQEEQIEQLEHDLAVTENNINYYVNGNN